MLSNEKLRSTPDLVHITGGAYRYTPVPEKLNEPYGRLYIEIQATELFALLRPTASAHYLTVLLISKFCRVPTVVLHYVHKTYEDEIAREFRNIGTSNSDAGELPERRNTSTSVN
jgi:hypothetical protein